MTPNKIKTQSRLLAVVAGLLPAACAFFPLESSPSPLIGTWTTEDRNQVAFHADSVVVTPDKGQAATMGPGDCNGNYKLVYGRMGTAPLEAAFPAQPDLQSKLKQVLAQPDYPVADVTCGDGGTTYLMLDERQMIAVYRDAGVGGVERLTRL